MKPNTLAIGVVFILLLSACGPRSAPTANPLDIQGTAQAAAFTMIAQTQAAIPSATPNPPTDTPVPTSSLPTETPPPLPTLGIEGTAGTPATGVTLPTPFPTFTQQAPQAPSGSGNNQDVCNQPLTSWQGPTANFTILNQTCPNAALLVFASPVFHFPRNSAMTGDYIMRVFYDILFFRLRAMSKFDCHNVYF